MISEKKQLSNIERNAHKRTGIERRNYLRLDMNENIDSLPEDFVYDVLKNIDGEMLSIYPNQEETTELLADYNNIEYDNILLTNGSDGAINWIFETFVSSGDKILMTNPTFAMYKVYGKIYEADVLEAEYENDLKFPYQKFMNQLEKGIKLAIIVNPNNPCGTVLEEDKIVKIMEKAFQNNILLIVDEAYFYFYTETVKEYIKKYNNIIVLRTFSKVCAIAALRVGYIMADANIIYNIKKVALSFDVNSIGLLFVNSLVKNKNIIDGLVEKVNSGKKYIEEELTKMNVSYVMGHGCFMLIKVNGDLSKIKTYFKENGILVSTALKKYIRINLGSPKKMQIFLDVLKKLFNETDIVGNRI